MRLRTVRYALRAHVHAYIYSLFMIHLIMCENIKMGRGRGGACGAGAAHAALSGSRGRTRTRGLPHGPRCRWIENEIARINLQRDAALARVAGAPRRAVRGRGPR